MATTARQSKPARKGAAEPARYVSYIPPSLILTFHRSSVVPRHGLVHELPLLSRLQAVLLVLSQRPPPLQPQRRATRTVPVQTPLVTAYCSPSPV